MAFVERERVGKHLRMSISFSPSARGRLKIFFFRFTAVGFSYYRVLIQPRICFAHPAAMGRDDELPEEGKRRCLENPPGMNLFFFPSTTDKGQKVKTPVVSRRLSKRVPLSRRRKTPKNRRRRRKEGETSCGAVVTQARV